MRHPAARVLLGLALLAAACAAPDGSDVPVAESGIPPTSAEMPPPTAVLGEHPPAPARPSARDLLTDLADDGSLVAGIADASPAVRRVASRGLAHLADAQGVAALAARAAVEPDPEVLSEMLFALGQRGTRAAPADVAGPALRAQLEHPAASVRAAAVTGLGRLADDDATEALSATLADPDAEVRGSAALALFRLDGRRYDHVRHAGEDQLARRDAALMAVARADTEAGVRWRAIYAMAGVRTRPALTSGLREALGDSEPLCRLFALRGLRAHAGDEARTHAEVARDALPLLDDEDARVVIEALRCLARAGEVRLLVGILADLARPPLVRFVAAETLSDRLGEEDVADEVRRSACGAVTEVVEQDPSAMVRREAAAVIVQHAPDHAAHPALHALGRSEDARERERAARLLADGVRTDEVLLERLAADSVPVVAATALEAPMPDREVRTARLLAALASDDAALLTVAAQVAEAEAQDGTAAPDLMRALATAHERTGTPEMKEARQALRKALGMEPDTAAPPAPPEGRLLDRLLALDREARADPSPRVRLATTRGDIELRLDRVAAPRHVASFLELAAAGFYDGLGFHRVVPDFVVQGLDPRGDGWGTGGRRMPDEFNPRPYLTGTLGMPHAGEAHTGGCQIFLTHVPTPHLDGAYTVFGHVVSGLDVMQRLQIGDVVREVRRID
ncbi:MAG: peptidylprolyl isomerase [Planctomycetota bacterium]